MAPPTKNFEREGTQQDDYATSDSDHSNLDQRMEVKVNNGRRFPADTSPMVWLNVFSKLDPADKPAFFRAMPEWNAMMATKSTHFLVPEVVPSLLEILPKKSLLQSRLLNKTWTKGLDRHIENHSAHLYLPFEIAYEESHPFLKHVHKFTSAGSIQSFLQEMESHPGNPLIWRNIELEWEEPPGMATSPELKLLCLEYWNNAILLLNTFGRHALYVKIDFTGSVRLNGLELARIFHSLLDNLPSLKRLSMWGTYLHHTLLIQTYFRRNPLPLLPNLEAVDTHSPEKALVSAVINCCCDPQKMRRLKLTEIIEIETKIPEMVYNFSNLEVISMPFIQADLQRLGNQEVVPPLREVDLCKFRLSPVLGELFACLQPLKNTLVSVSCFEVRVKRNGVGAETRIDLPNLRRLYVRFYEGNLVQFSGSLTHLTIYDSRAISDDEKEALGLSSEVDEQPAKGLVDFYGFERNMYRSNIWELFPFLISIKVGIYSREFKRSRYERIQADKGSLVSISGRFP